MIQSSTREREVTRAKDIVSVLSDACYRLSAEHLMRRRTVLAPGTFFFVVKKISTKTESIQTNIFLGVSCKGNYLEILDNCDNFRLMPPNCMVGQAYALR